MLRYTLLGKRMRALSDDLDLAETSGIDTSRVILYTWVFAGALRRPGGRHGGGDSPSFDPSSASSCCCRSSPPCAGRDRQRLRRPGGGLVLGVVIEWSTLFIEARWKVAIGFVVLIIVLIIRPQGIFGKAKAI